MIDTACSWTYPLVISAPIRHTQHRSTKNTKIQLCHNSLISYTKVKVTFLSSAIFFRSCRCLSLYSLLFTIRIRRAALPRGLFFCGTGSVARLRSRFASSIAAASLSALTSDSLETYYAQNITIQFIITRLYKAKHYGLDNFNKIILILPLTAKISLAVE